MLGIAAVLGAGAAAFALTSSSSAATTPAQQSLGWHDGCTTGSNGQCTVANRAGVDPDSIVITPRRTVVPVTISTSATQITVRFIQTGSAAVFVGAVNFDVHVDYTPAPPTTPTTAPPTTPTTTPTSPPTTPPTTGPAQFPPANYPNSSNTGVPAGTTLTAYTGPATVPGGTTIDGKDITKCLTIGGNGVVIKNSKVHASCSYVIDSIGNTGTALQITDSEVYCDPASDGQTAIGEENVSLLRVNIHGCENGLDVNTKFTVVDSYIHDLAQTAAAHTDGAQVWAGATALTFQHNTIFGSGPNGDGTSSIILPHAPAGGASNVTIDGNLFGGGAYSLYCVQDGAGTNVKVTNNKFTTHWEAKGGAYGPWVECADEAVVTGNTWLETGQPVPLA